MTSPNYDPDFAERLRTATAAVGDKPQQALTLAQSDLTTGDIGMVGGFTSALETSQLVKLARQSGAQIDLTADQRSALDTLGEPYADVDAATPDDDNRNLLERIFDGVGDFLANTGSAIAHLPGVHQVFTALDWLNDGVHLPARILSSGLDTSNDDEVDAAMLAHGYDPNSVGSYLAFMWNQGDALYHDLDGLRDVHGDKLVDLAIEQQYDPERFAEELSKKSEEDQQLILSPEFAQVSDLVNRQHISPGRDIARGLTFGNVDTPAFTAISGFLDGAYTLLLDPTLVVGKAYHGVRALDAAGQATRSANLLDRARFIPGITRGLDRGITGAGSLIGRNWNLRSGLRDARDTDGVRALYAVDEHGQAVTRVGKDTADWLDTVRRWEEATDPAEKSVIFAGLSTRYRNMLPFLDEARGRRITLGSPSTINRQAEQQADDLLAANIELENLPGVAEAAAAVDQPLRGLAAARDVAVGMVVKAKPSSGTGQGRSITFRVTQITRGNEGNILLHGEQAVKGTYSNSKRRVTRVLLEDERLEVVGGGGRIKATRNPDGSAPEYVDPLAPAPVVDDVPIITDAVPLDYIARGHDGAHLATQGESIWAEAERRGITPLEVWADYFASTTGMLRFAGGAAAKREVYLPGRVALRQRIAGRRAEARQRNIYDHSQPYRVMPHEVEEEFQTELDQLERARALGHITESEYAERGDAIYQRIRGKAGFIRKQRAKFEQRARRVSSLLPTVQAIDLTDARSLEQVRSFARLYMDKAEADRLTAIYAAGDLGQRRSVLNGIIEQTFHASGLSRSEAGLKEIERFRLEQVGLDKRAYGLARSDVIKTDAGVRHVALLPSQLSEHVLIPDFRSLQYLSTKFAVGGAFTKAGHLRSLATGETADAIIGAIKMGWITSAAGGFRNALDEVAGAVLKGDGVSLLRGRAAFAEAIKLGKEASAAERRRGASLLARFRFRIAEGLRHPIRSVHDFFTAEALTRLMFFRKAYEPTELDVKYAQELRDLQQQDLVSTTITGTYLGDDLLRDNADALEMHQAGLAARPVRHDGQLVKHEFVGWDQLPIDDGSGYNALANSLGMAFQDLTSPAHVALRAITTGGDAIGDVVKYMHEPVMRHFVRNAERFKWTPNGTAVGNDPVLLEQAIEQYAIDLTAHTTMLVTGRGNVIAEADKAINRPAVYEFDITRPGWEHGVIDQEGRYIPPTVGPINQELVARLQKGDIPSNLWLKENLATEELPSHAVGKRWAPVNLKSDPVSVGRRLASGWTEALSVGYDFFVTKQIRALSRNPMLTAAYVQARHNLAKYEKHLVDDQGFTEEVAAEIAQRSALRQAEALVIKSIDDPTLSTQYAMLARNLHAFARAQEDWLRRWGRVIRDNPEVVRKGQLAIQGGESAGILEQDADGNLIFTYPGSGLLINLLGKLTSKIPGLPDMAKLPVVPDLTSRLIFLNPSLDNPAGFSATPLVSIPFDILSAVTGADQTLIGSSMDRVVNGDLGAGRTWFEKILPGFANRIFASVPDEDMGSQYGSAFASALANMEAAGRLDELDGQDPTAIAEFQHDLKAQITNQLVMRALLGFVLPAAPSLPTNDVQIDYDQEIQTALALGDTDKAAQLQARNGQQVLEPDFVWERAGLASLKEEARAVFGSMDYASAQEWWSKNHPGELVFAPSGASGQSIVGDSDAQAPATVTAAKWLQDHSWFAGTEDGGYGGPGGLAAYFIPNGTPGTPGGKFSMDAYRAQLESGIREYKSLDQFFEDIVIQRGEATYFDTKDDVDAAIAEATAQGNLQQVHQLEDWWAQKKELIKAVNPLMAAKFAQYATSGVARDRTIGQLNRLLNDPRAVENIGHDQAGAIATMLIAQREYEAARDEVAYQRGFYANSRREEAKQLFESQIADVVRAFPELADLARGTFRIPD